LWRHFIEERFCEHILWSKTKDKHNGIELRSTKKSGAVTM